VRYFHIDNPQVRKSAFGCCSDAYALAYSLNYYFRNFEKFLSFLVYLEAILIQVDRRVADLQIGVQVGRIIMKGNPVPRKPTSIK
jgi:hypothetical protein